MFIIFWPLFPAFNFLGKRLDYSSTAAHFEDSGDFFLTFLNFFKPAEFDYVSNLWLKLREIVVQHEKMKYFELNLLKKIILPVSSFNMHDISQHGHITEDFTFNIFS